MPISKELARATENGDPLVYHHEPIKKENWCNALVWGTVLDWGTVILAKTANTLRRRSFGDVQLRHTRASLGFDSA